MIIRIAQETDFKEIINIYNSTIASRQVTADLKPVSVEERLGWFQAHQKPHRPMFVCCNTDNQIVAWATFSDYYARAAYDITAEISIYVSATQRGQKLGQTMLQHMLDMAPSLNIKNVVAVIFGHNTPSLALFEKFGFAHWGLLPRVCELDNIEADIVLLGKRLSD